MSITAATGFVAAGGHAGIKESGEPDLAVVTTEDGRSVPAAGVFTANKMTAAPVVVSKANLRAGTGLAAGVILNSGNANAATGEPGIDDAVEMCGLVASELGCHQDHVLVCSTGLIGYRLPMDPIRQAVPRLMGARSTDGGADAAEAIRTTDSVRKEAEVRLEGFTVGGMAKGAAMLAPHLATMLAVLTTDAEVEPRVLREVLTEATARTFNELTVDGACSTNDTVLLLASGRAGPVDGFTLAGAVTAVCESLARQMNADAEGATKQVEIHVTGAASDAEAAQAARRVAESQLTKCSWYGEDPYWGRIASDLGSAGVRFDAELVQICFGDVVVARRGMAVEHDEQAVADLMAQRELSITADLGIGPGRARVLTNDLTHAYVDENMGTS